MASFGLASVMVMPEHILRIKQFVAASSLKPNWDVEEVECKDVLQELSDDVIQAKQTEQASSERVAVEYSAHGGNPKKFQRGHRRWFV